MWPRRQRKARRRTHSSPAAARDKRDRVIFSWLAVVACSLIALVALLHDDDDGDGRDRRSLRRHVRDSSFTMSHLLRFLRDYPRRFSAFYVPKVEHAWRWSSALYQAVEVSDDITSALDFAVALIVVASVYHIIEIVRRTVLGRFQLQTRDGSEIQDKRDEQEAAACDAF